MRNWVHSPFSVFSSHVATLAFLAPFCLPAVSRAADEALSPEQQAAVEAIERLGGKIEYDKQHQVRGIDLRNQRVTDAQLAPLEAFPKLKTLVLWGPRVTSRGLAHIAGLTDLVDLELDNC